MSLVLQYHEIRGLAAPLRMMLEFTGTKYENKYADEWFSHEKEQTKQKNPLANLPCVFDESGTIVTQSCAAFWFIGERLGFNGTCDRERSRVDQIVCQIQDWRNAAIRGWYAPLRVDTFSKHMASVKSHYEKLEGIFKRSGFVYSASNKLTTGDFHLFEMIDTHEDFARVHNQPSPISSGSYPLLRDFYTRFYALPQLQAYFSGPLHKLPVNNPKFATFVGSPDLFEPKKLQPDDKKAEKITVGYWKIRGLAAPLRMMCVFAGEEDNFESKEYECVGAGSTGFDRSAWDSGGKPALKALNPMINLPYVKCGDELVTQSNACLFFLGRKFGLMGSSMEQTAQIKQVIWQTIDLRNAAVGEFYGSSGSAEDSKKYAAKVKVHFDKLEAWMKQMGTDFSAGKEVTAADFHLFEMLDQHEEWARATSHPAILPQYPSLTAFYKRFRALPQLKSYFDGPMHKLPVNNPHATFGAHPDYSSLAHYKSM